MTKQSVLYAPNRVAAMLGSSLCLLIIALAIGWLPFLILTTATLLLWLGYQFAIDGLLHERARIKSQRRALDAEWESLEQTRRVRAVFLEARRAMQTEARAAWPPADDGQEAEQ